MQIKFKTPEDKTLIFSWLNMVYKTMYRSKDLTKEILAKVILNLFYLYSLF